MGLRVQDEGASESRSVMGRIGVVTLPYSKGCRLPSGVDGREQSANRRSKRRRYVGEVATTFAGAACATADPLGSRHCLSNAQADSKANGAAALRKGCRRPAEPCWVVSRRGVV